MENQKPSLPQDQHPRVWRLPTEAKKLRSPSRCKQWCTLSGRSLELAYPWHHRARTVNAVSGMPTGE